MVLPTAPAHYRKHLKNEADAQKARTLPLTPGEVHIPPAYGEPPTSFRVAQDDEIKEKFPLRIIVNGEKVALLDGDKQNYIHFEFLFVDDKDNHTFAVQPSTLYQMFVKKSQRDQKKDTPIAPTFDSTLKPFQSIPVLVKYPEPPMPDDFYTSRFLDKK